MAEGIALTGWPPEVLDIAKDFASSPLEGYVFTTDEGAVLSSFFTNFNRRVFFMHNLPANVGASLLAMFSRIKNRRGIRGVFVDSFLPQLLVAQLDEVKNSFGGDAGKFLKENKITDLSRFISHSAETTLVFRTFLDRLTIDATYLGWLTQSEKPKAFLKTWLDDYGHNSIARMASVWICFEQISILAAKSIEWGRPGSGYIELSTRYVDMSGKGSYPIECELEKGWEINPEEVIQSRNLAFRIYHNLAGEKFDGIFPNQLRAHFGEFFVGSPKDLESGVTGETCDVLGNLLPASTLTSLAANVSGEALPDLLKHLALDGTPENIALAEMITKEAEHIGADQFIRHFEPSRGEACQWDYLEPSKFKNDEISPWVRCLCCSATAEQHKNTLELALCLKKGFLPHNLEKRTPLEHLYACTGNLRDDHDKLPSDFEVVNLPFFGVMSFRGWRDLHRQSLCTHNRTLLTPWLGFYHYDKLDRSSPEPTFLYDAFDAIAGDTAALYRKLKEKGIPYILAQYVLALGWNVGFTISANLREWEFCNWQRTKFSVNHEVRQVFLAIENRIRQLFPWWHQFSRADMTPAYIFARSSRGIPLLNTSAQ